MNDNATYRVRVPHTTDFFVFLGTVRVPHTTEGFGFLGTDGTVRVERTTEGFGLGTAVRTSEVGGDGGLHRGLLSTVLISGTLTSTRTSLTIGAGVGTGVLNMTVRRLGNGFQSLLSNKVGGRLRTMVSSSSSSTLTLDPSLASS